MRRPTLICEAWDVVSVPFPFTDHSAGRRRPALVLSPAGAVGGAIPHAVLAMITSEQHPAWALDVPLRSYQTAGLPAPSVVRMKVFTLDTRLIVAKLGQLTDEDTLAVEAALRRAFHWAND